MNHDDQRRVIAEACGWYDFGTTAPERGSMTPRIIGRNKEAMDRRIIPDYPFDLNAMHEAEKILSDRGRMEYFKHLFAMCGKKYEGGAVDIEIAMMMIGWAAERKSEAFLKTIGKWEESP